MKSRRLQAERRQEFLDAIAGFRAGTSTESLDAIHTRFSPQDHSEQIFELLRDGKHDEVDQLVAGEQKFIKQLLKHSELKEGTK